MGLIAASGTIVLPVPVSRSPKQDLLPYVATADGKLLRGALTGDVWFEVVQTECVGGDTAYTFNKSERPLGILVLPCDWAGLVPVREIGTNDVRALTNVLGGRDARVARLYGKFTEAVHLVVMGSMVGARRPRGLKHWLDRIPTKRNADFSGETSQPEFGMENRIARFSGPYVEQRTGHHSGGRF